MLQPVRRAAVKAVKPLLSDRAWRALRRLDPSNPGPARGGATGKPRGASLVEAGVAAGYASSRRKRVFLAELEPVLTRRPRARVAVVADSPDDGLGELLGSSFPRATVTVLQAGWGESLLHARLAARGPYDLVVDLVTKRAEPARAYATLLYHLRPGGQLAVADVDPKRAAPSGLRPLITRLLEVRSATVPTARNYDEEALARATRRVVLADRHLLVTNATTSYAKLRETEMDPVLEVVGERVGTVFGRVEAERFTPRSVIRDHSDETVVRAGVDIDVPALALREYVDVTCAPGQVVAKDNLLLPETYRHILQRRLLNRMTDDIHPRFAGVKRDISQPQPLPGAYFHLDLEWPGHYGHVLTEQMSRMWGWDVAKQRVPELKALVGRRGVSTDVQTFERAILESLGVPGEDIVVYDKPVRVERLLTATPMFSMPEYVSPRIAPVWNTVGRVVGAQAGEEETPRRIFCGRQRKTRLCHNSDAVEETFARAGFEIVFPEHMPFPSQIAMFRNAEVVAGYAGSALFTLAFCDQSKRVIMVSPDNYRANNEYLFAAVLGHEFDVLWCVADGPATGAHYTFDFEREGRHLRRLLDELD